MERRIEAKRVMFLNPLAGLDTLVSIRLRLLNPSGYSTDALWPLKVSDGESSTQSRFAQNLKHSEIEEGLDVGGFEHHGGVGAFARASDGDDAATYM